MRTGITVYVSLADRARRDAVVADRNSPQRQVWRARIVLLSADDRGTSDITKLADKSKPYVWPWQERFIAAGAEWPLA
jgi:hypothetical protein